jgi:hypothetical protein
VAEVVVVVEKDSEVVRQGQCTTITRDPLGGRCLSRLLYWHLPNEFGLCAVALDLRIGEPPESLAAVGKVVS